MHYRPVSNVERQRQFRARHPGYFGRYKVSKRDVELYTAAVLAAAGLPQTQVVSAPAEQIDLEMARALASA